MGSANIHIYIYIPSRGSFSWTRGRFGGFMKKTKGFRRKPADSWENDRCDVAGVGHGHHHHPWPLWWHHFAASWRSGSRLGKAKNTRVYWVKKKLCRLAVWVCRSQLESIDGPKNEIFEQNLNRIWTGFEQNDDPFSGQFSPCAAWSMSWVLPPLWLAFCDGPFNRPAYHIFGLRIAIGSVGYSPLDQTHS